MRPKSIAPEMVKALGRTTTAPSAAAVLGALEHVYSLPGDLHIKVHKLDFLFRLCFGGPLQPAQPALGWKRIHEHPIDCPQASRRPVKFVLGELQRYELDLFLQGAEKIKIWAPRC